MLSLVIAAALLQAVPDAAPAPAAPTPAVSTAAPTGRQLGGGLPKDDYGLVAWCHGALAGQLELDPIAKEDMEKIEGKAKVAARAKSDAEMEAERRVYLKDYEHALAAAEAASPTAIHEKGVAAEQQGYRMWAETREKAPIWRMLDWGMWDPNDVGCGEAAKRLYDRSKLFGLALKNTSDDTKPDAPVETPAATAVSEPAPPASDFSFKPADPAKAETALTATPAAPDAAGDQITGRSNGGEALLNASAPEGAAPIPNADVPAPAPAAVAAEPPAPTKKATKSRSKAAAKASAAESVRAAVASDAPETPKPVEAEAVPAPPPADPDKPADSGLRGPQ